MITFGSLFAGVGGFDLGFERAGLTCKWQVEIDDYATRVLEKHWPDVPKGRDVRHFPPGYARDWAVDVICGGPPCQRTSVAAAIQGKRTGETLWPEMLRVVRAIEPRCVVVEQPGGNKAWEE
ncbi:MAG: DNA cytosine methyltransferase, partial [Bradyrhizobium sp.]|nr:DNA cytosine methyltransferase [Bradyrhizobium sp.]